MKKKSHGMDTILMTVLVLLFGVGGPSYAGTPASATFVVG